MFSSVITEEKEQRTLGLLRLAGFRAIWILVGKSLGQLVSAMLLLALQIPFGILCIALGGVSVSQVMAAFSMLSAYMLFLAGLGLLCSTVTPRSGAAARFAAEEAV